MEFKRKKNESFEAFLRRFNRTIIRSRKLFEIRQNKYLRPKMNKSKQKDYALTSMKLREKKEYLKKIGRIKEETKGRW
jgi:ribosomal protein S21